MTNIHGTKNLVKFNNVTLPVIQHLDLQRRDRELDDVGFSINSHFSL